ncbi:MAG: hypothetical protein RL210_2491 [Pseudomonadota bacterium]|jgi:acyl-CoA thioesterase FadM
MNLYFRFWLILWQSIFAKAQGLLQPSHLRFSVFPTDCDLNLHLTNSRYLSFMDLGRTHLLGQTGLLRLVFRQRIASVAQAVEITFFREMAPFSRFTLESRVVCWDERYCYIQHEFQQNGQLCASAMIRVVFLKAGKRLPMAEVIQLLGIDLPSPPFPEQIAAWAAVFEIKKNKQR